MIIVNPNNPIPKYLQISAWLKDAIQHGRYKIGEKLPSEIELSRMCRVNRNTLRQAVGELTADGLLQKVKGIGTFVSSVESHPVRHKLNRISSLGLELQQSGVREKTRLLKKGYEVPTQYVAKNLAVSPNSKIIAIRRVRSGDEHPLIYEETYLPADLFDGILDMDLTGSMYEIFTREFGVILARSAQTIRAVNLNRKIAQQLGVKQNSAALYLESVTYNDRNMPVEVLYSYFRGDKYVFEVELGQYHLTP
ncbi:MAG: hypothetical protein COS92_06515 [Desulfobacterales bacterium CG07_land_8_20_14_0_80_52_14]|nr:MAG: hypothetical protein COS92_06515 [Desulfobacterales bacterium CG07_land_8_20_14_0_80_52_14]